MIRVLIRALSPIAKAGLESLIRTHPSFELAEDSPDDFLTGGTVADLMPDALLAEVAGRDDQSAQEALDWAADGGIVVILLDDARAERAADALRAGVKAVLPRNASGPEIVAAIEAVAAGLVVLHPAEVDLVLPARAEIPGERVAALAEPLTAREIEVLRLLADGFSNKAIASRLEISEHTVKFHVASIMGKLGATSRTEAVTLGIRHGLIML